MIQFQIAFDFYSSSKKDMNIAGKFDSYFVKLT